MKNDNDVIVDAVITWVDGNDPVHMSKMGGYMLDKNTMNAKSVRMRYDQVNEIEFAVKSILKYAKFVRKIFIVTDNQTPEFLKDKELFKKKYSQVVVVDHKNIFKGYEQYLPIFNSLSIESMLFRVPDLSEHFIYFNDDFFLVNKTKVGDFFREGEPVIRGFWTKFYEDIWHKIIKAKYQVLTNTKPLGYSHNKGLQMPAKRLGFKKYVHIDHTVAALRKSTVLKFFTENPEVLDRNIKHRFRHPEQYSVQSLANHLEIKNNSFTLIENYQLVYFQNYKKPFLWIKFKLNSIKKNTNKLFLCMQSLKECPQEKLTYIMHWLRAKYD
jgi:hypothetical protein